MSVSQIIEITQIKKIIKTTTLSRNTGTRNPQEKPKFSLTAANARLKLAPCDTLSIENCTTRE